MTAAQVAPVPNSIPSTILPSNAAGTGSGNLAGRQVSTIEEKRYVTPTSKLLKVLAIVLIVIASIACLAALGLSFALAAKGTSYVEYTPYITVGVSIMGKPGAIAAIVTSAVLGGLGITGGVKLLQHKETVTIERTITNTSTREVVIEIESDEEEEEEEVVPPVATVPVAAPSTPIAAVPAPVPTTPVAVVAAPVQVATPVVSPPKPYRPKVMFKSTQDYRAKGITDFPGFLYQAGEPEGVKHLFLGNNALNTIPKEVNALLKLETLDLSHNNFTDLRNLELLPNGENVLELNEDGQIIRGKGQKNPGKGQITRIQPPSTIKVLDLRGNPLTSIPAGIAKLTTLKTILIEKDKFPLLPLAVQQNPDIEKNHGDAPLKF